MTSISKQDAIKFLERRSSPGWNACSDSPTISLAEAKYLIDIIYTKAVLAQSRSSDEVNLLGTAFHLENYLTSKRISQHQLARDLEVSQAHISQVLSRKIFISEKLAVKLEKLTGLSARQLLIEDMEYKLQLLEKERG
ncbi:TPA: transcriptional regulator [Streptococcus suis]